MKNIKQLLLPILLVLVGCQKDTEFSLSTQESQEIIDNIYNEMIGVSGKEYSLGRYEVTQEQWLAVMGFNPSRVKGAKRPVESLVESEIEAFVEKLVEATGLSYRLPTTSEWYSASGYMLDDVTNIGDIAWYSENSGSSAHEVGKKSPNSQGFYDMLGNVAEYVSSTSITPYSAKARGGSYISSFEDCFETVVYNTHVDNINDNSTIYRAPTLGFRLLIDEYIEPEVEQTLDPEEEVESPLIEDGKIIISSAEGLLCIGNHDDYPLNGMYKLNANINLSDFDWTPIGNKTYPFTGVFDGNNKTISALNIYSTSYYQGLFGYISGATISNVILSAPYINSSNNYVGAVVGYDSGNSTITNCAVVGGSIIGSSYLGGVIGYSNSVISNCYNTATVSSSSVLGFVGGVIGMSKSSVTACYNTGKVIGSGPSVGGVVGNMSSSSYSITACYNTGDVSSNTDIGGVVGTSSSIVAACYNTGAISCSSNFVGGVVGRAFSTVYACYNTGEIKGSYPVGAVVGSTSYSVTACYFIDQLSDDATLGIGYTNVTGDTAVSTTVNVLNSSYVSLMNSTIQVIDFETFFTIGSPSSTNLPHLMGENLLYTGDGVVEATYNKLTDFSYATYPTDTDTWVINDIEASSGVFEGLEDALLSNLSRSISLSFPYLTTIPEGALIAWQIANVVSVSLPNATSIGDYFLYCCDALTSLELATTSGVKLTAIGANVFLKLENTQNIVLTIGYANSGYVSGNTLTIGEFSKTFKEIIIVNWVDDDTDVNDETTDPDTAIGDAPDMEYETLF